MTTYNNLYMDIRRRLREAGISSASLEARELVCCGSGKTREELLRDAQLYVAPETEEIIRTLTDRHLNGEPVAYLLGEWEFYGLTLDVTEAVLIPRVDTEVLAGEAIAWLKGQEPCRVLDLCAGSGCIGLALARHVPGCRVLLGEISEAAVRICRQNIRRTGQTGRVSAMVLDALAPPPRAIGTFRCIVCNPPYIPRGDIGTLERSVKDFEPYQALCGGEDGLDFYRAVTRDWGAALAPGGRLLFEVGIGQAEAVLALMEQAGFEELCTIPDDQGIRRVAAGIWKKDS